jgi:MOSC domain-containing protein YiiM
MQRHRTAEELEAGLEAIRQSPKETGVLELISRRPRTEEREVLQEAEISLTEGLVGDNWKTRGSSRTTDGSAHPDLQVTLMNSRVIALLAEAREHWAMAGDQLFVDLDLSTKNLPPGTQLEIGGAVIEITDYPHTGCKKFVARFGPDATKFVNSPMGRELQLRGVNAKVIRAGKVRVGDVVRKRSFFSGSVEGQREP